uniref:Uncharacterized protein n=1 Tax=Tanacetum cinerariifolium TaxID=118510 RepID=A0A6L2NJ93_TANCI|nr:hypothetical protein [Tanacetum cinerariifolium]
MFLNVNQLEKQLDKEEFQENASTAAFRVLKTQFQKFINSWFSLDDDDGLMTRKSVNEKQMLTKEGKVDFSTVDASLVVTESGETEFEKQYTSSGLGNDADADDANIKPIYDEEPMVEVQLTTNNIVFAPRQQHAKQPEFDNEGGVYHVMNNVMTYSVAQFPQEFSKLESRCINLELELQNNVLKSGQQGQFLKIKSNEVKVKKNIDDFKRINIELEYSVVTLLKENEHLKKTYKDLYDSIKKTSVQTKDHADSLIVQLNYITNPHECKKTLDLSAGTSINVQKEQNLNFSERTPIDREKIKALIINRIAGRSMSYGITLEKEIKISERPKFQEIQSLPTS